MDYTKILLKHSYPLSPYFLNRTMSILLNNRTIAKQVYLIFDFETDALGFKNTRPIQLSYTICGHNGCIIEKRTDYIKGCVGLGPFWDNTDMTLKKINAGSDIKTVLLNLVDKMKLVNSYGGIMVGHNIAFDIRVLKQSINFLLTDLSTEEKTVLSTIVDKCCDQKICTMLTTRSFCGLNKNPKLSELHDKLFPSEKECKSKYHNAEYDVHITKKCLIAYLSIHKPLFTKNYVVTNIQNNIDMYFNLYNIVQQLDLSNLDIDDMGVKMLYYSPVCDLNLTNCKNITNKVFKYIRHLPLLKLNITGTQITLSASHIKAYYSKKTVIIQDNVFIPAQVIIPEVVHETKIVVPETKVSFLPDISEEQQTVVKHIAHKNVQVNSVAGSGKTTTILYVATTYSDKTILVLTYNKQLKADTRMKISKLGLKNTECHSYHSFCVKYYDNKCYNDVQIMNVLDKKTTNPQYDLIILDEAQDITPLYYEIICKLFRNSRLLLLGDPRQCIYTYKDADSRYMSLCDIVFDFSKYEWTNLKLSTTFRLTSTMTHFLNKCILKNDELVAVKQSTILPRYLICNSYSYPIKEIEYYIKTKHYNYDDIFVLAPSVRKNSVNSPVIILANTISRKYNYPIYVPDSDEQKVESDVTKGKIGFMSLNQVKGLERKVVIVFGFDMSYFKLFDKKSDPKICPNVFYVGLTRSLECLSVIHDEKEACMQFVNMKDIRKHTEFINVNNVITTYDVKSSQASNEYRTCPTALIRHIKDEILLNACSFFETKTIETKSSVSNIPIKTKQADLVETVSEITGTIIPAYAEYKLTGNMAIAKAMKTDVVDMSIPELLKLATKYCSMRSGYVYKTIQIKTYNWITQKQLDDYSRKIMTLVDKNAEFEYELDECIINTKINGKDMVIKLLGVIDCVSNGIIYEFKCVSELVLVHQIQLAIYAYMYLKTKSSNIRCILYNIFTNEKIEIIYDIENLKNMIAYLVEYKLFYENNNTDDLFIKNANSIKSKYFF